MPTKVRYLNVDLAKVYSDPEMKKLVNVFAWGDAVRVKKETSKSIEIEYDRKSAFIRKPEGETVLVDKKENQVMKVDFVDVQQGDGAVIETPAGKVVLVDGGDNQLFARYLAARYRGSSAKRPKEIDCIVVTHGDADHFEGLTKIRTSEDLAAPRKQLFIQPKRVYHNGLVKRPSKSASGKATPPEKMLGATKSVDGTLFITGLENDLLAVPEKEMNKPFRDWREALKHWKKRGKIEIRRLELGMDDAFEFLHDEDIDVQVLGPLTEEVGGRPALKFLGNPPKGPRIGHESLSLDEKGFKGKSASHTINGHSIIFRLTYGQFNLLFTGDLNDEAGRVLAREHNRGTINLRAEVFKVPHHGSADFSGAFIQAVSPAVSVISSGDESTAKEYVHPRATIMGTLGKFARVEEPLIFVTELVAFFSLVGAMAKETKGDDEKAEQSFIAFERASFGIVKIRTDGQRLLVYTNSAKKEMKEAYAYTIDEYGKPEPAFVRMV